MDLRELQQSFQEESRCVTTERLAVGALVITVLSEDEGLTFNNGRTEKPKRLIIIGKDLKQEIYYGSVLVNTKINPRAKFSDEYLSAQYLLKQETYPDFLEYDSYVDCGMLFSISFEKLAKGQYFGVLTDEDKNNLFEILETTATLSTKEKKRFGIKRRCTGSQGQVP